MLSFGDCCSDYEEKVKKLLIEWVKENNKIKNMDDIIYYIRRNPEKFKNVVSTNNDEDDDDSCFEIYYGEKLLADIGWDMFDPYSFYNVDVLIELMNNNSDAINNYNSNLLNHINDLMKSQIDFDKELGINGNKKLYNEFKRCIKKSEIGYRMSSLDKLIMKIALKKMYDYFGI